METYIQQKNKNNEEKRQGEKIKKIKQKANSDEESHEKLNGTVEQISLYFSHVAIHEVVN